MSSWRPCIVVLIDVIGIKNLASEGTTAATDKMRSLHKLTNREMTNTMSSLSHAYLWNDSVLLIGHLDTANTCNILRDASQLKDKVDKEIGSSYAICVKGESFPEETCTSCIPRNNSIQPRSTVIQASSFALANCFEIEKRLGKNKASWYIDERVHSAITVKPRDTKSIQLLPNNKRKILMFDGSISQYICLTTRSE